MAEAKMPCPVKGNGACFGPTCGHCRHCGYPLDNHNGLGLNGKPIDCKALGV